MKNLRSKNLLIIVLILLAIILPACSGGATPAPTAQPTAAATSVATATAKPTGTAATAAPTAKPTGTATTATPAVVQRSYTAQKPLVIRCSNAFTLASSPGFGFTVDWAKEITDRTGGAIKFEFYWGGVLSKPGEELDQLKKNFIDCALSSSTWYGVMLLWEMTSFLPFQPPDSQLSMKVKWQLYQEFPELQDEVTRWNIVPMIFYAGESYQLQSIAPVRTLADLKGKKVGVLGRAQQSWFEVPSMGATAMTVTGPDRYDALAKKTIDVNLQSVSYQLGEVAPYTEHVNLGSLVTIDWAMNRDTWNKIVPEDQAWILALNQKYMLEKIPANGKAQLAQDEAAIVSKWKGEIINFPQSERMAWAKGLPNLGQRWIDEAKDAAEHAVRLKIYKRYLELTATSGYQWPMDWSNVK